ncbi:MAG: primosomal protein N' [Balneolia bacterium]|nr:primosomal protein N' [Balneolia bacterium]
MPSPETKTSEAVRLFADIALPVAVREVFTYELPEDLSADAQPGMRAWVPLRGRMNIGMIVRIHNEIPAFDTKPVRRLLDEMPVLDSDMLELTRWMHRFYVAGWGEVVQSALPAGLNFSSATYVKAVEQSPDAVVSLTKTEEEIYNELLGYGAYPHKEAQQRWSSAARVMASLRKKGLLELWDEPYLDMKTKTVLKWHWKEKREDEIREIAQSGKLNKWQQGWLKLLSDDPLPATSPALNALDNALTNYSIGRLEKEGIIEKKEHKVSAAEPDYDFEPQALSALNEHQEKVLKPISEAITQNRYEKFLIYGITGSGKTEVYIHALMQAVEQGKGALVLVPEIALTPQTVRRFYRIFGKKIAILHSRLSDRERFDAWQALRKGEKNIVIGARSAVFAPIKNLGIIIIDEEHDTSYYQADPAPRYHVREVATVRAFKENAALVLGSATPSLVSLVETTKKSSRLLRLPSRHSGATLPEVKVLSLTEYKHAMRGPLAVPMYTAVEEAAARGEQIILLYNRRGFASFMQCDSCGDVVECPHCSVSLTYHKRQQHLRCHYCGFSSAVPYTCPGCDSHELQMQGSGTQQIEEELTGLFPDLRVLRMDQDTTSRKNAHDRILSSFGRGEADILIGTQLVAKGLDFPNVTVVGVINADTELAFPSYRSNERMFQLLSQVSGRSGRADKKGVVYLQTKQPEHFAIRFAREHDFEGFARHELSIRKPLLYPPYSRLLQFSFKGKDATTCMKAAEQFTRVMEQSGTPWPVLGPTPDVIEKMNDEYRWVTMMKLPPDIKTAKLERLCDYFYTWYDKTKPDGASTVRITLSHEMI